MSINDTFVKDFGGRTLRFLQTKTKSTSELRSFQSAFITNFNQIMNSNVVQDVIIQAKLDAAEGLARELRSEIAERTKRLQEVEEVITSKRRNVEPLRNVDPPMFDDSDDVLLSQISEADLTQSTTSSTEQAFINSTRQDVTKEP